MQALHDKVALVTGGSRGIGAASALALAKAGANVAVNYRSHKEEAEKVCSAIRASGRRAVSLPADVSNSAAVAEMITRVQTELGPVGILVNNAGIARPQPIDQISEEDWDELTDRTGGESSTYPR